MKTNQTEKKEVAKIYFNAGKSKKGNTYVAVKIVDVEGNESVHYINKTGTNKNGEVVAFDDEKKVFVKRKGEMIFVHYDGNEYQLSQSKYGWAWYKPIENNAEVIIAALGLEIDDNDIISNESESESKSENENEGESGFDDILDI